MKRSDVVIVKASTVTEWRCSIQHREKEWSRNVEIMLKKKKDNYSRLKIKKKAKTNSLLTIKF